MSLWVGAVAGVRTSLADGSDVFDLDKCRSCLEQVVTNTTPNPNPNPNPNHSLLTPYSSLLTPYSSLLTTYYLLLTTYYLLLTTFLLRTTYYSTADSAITTTTTIYYFYLFLQRTLTKCNNSCIGQVVKLGLAPTPALP